VQELGNQPISADQILALLNRNETIPVAA